MANDALDKKRYANTVRGLESNWKARPHLLPNHHLSTLQAVGRTDGAEKMLLELVLGFVLFVLFRFYFGKPVNYPPGEVVLTFSHVMHT